jgi:hypothetical protein
VSLPVTVVPVPVLSPASPTSRLLASPEVDFLREMQFNDDAIDVALRRNNNNVRLYCRTLRKNGSKMSE